MHFFVLFLHYIYQYQYFHGGGGTFFCPPIVQSGFTFDTYTPIYYDISARNMNLNAFSHTSFSQLSCKKGLFLFFDKQATTLMLSAGCQEEDPKKLLCSTILLITQALTNSITSEVVCVGCMFHVCHIWITTIVIFFHYKFKSGTIRKHMLA